MGEIWLAFRPCSQYNCLHYIKCLYTASSPQQPQNCRTGPHTTLMTNSTGEGLEYDGSLRIM